MEKSMEKPRKKIDRSKKKRKVRSKVDFNVALGHKDLRYKSQACTYERNHRRNQSTSSVVKVKQGVTEEDKEDDDEDDEEEVYRLPENRTYTLPTSSEEDDEFDEECSDNEPEKIDIIDIRNFKETSESELEKELFGEPLIDTKTVNSECEKTVDDENLKSDRIKHNSENDENLEDDLDTLLNLNESMKSAPLVKTLTFIPSGKRTKSGWRSGNEKIYQLEKHLDSILDDM